MKTRKLSITICVSLLIVGLFGGCKGPQGEVGPQGETGLQGPGEVLYSPWFQGAWQSKGTKTSDFANSGITSQFNGELDLFLLYGKYSGTAVNAKVIFQFPATYRHDFSHAFYYRPEISRYGLSIYAISSSGFKTPYTLDTFTFKWVIVKGGSLINGRKAAIDYSDYEAVKKAYNIPD